MPNPGGAPLPFVPGVYQPNSTIAEMILRSGEVQARLQQQAGQQLGENVTNIGQVIAGGIQAHQQKETQQQVQTAVSAGMADPDNFESLVSKLPAPAAAQARKSFADANDAASRIAERHAKIAEEQARTQASLQALQQKNADDLGTIAFRTKAQLDSADGGLTALKVAHDIMKSKKLPGADAFDGPLAQMDSAWQKAQATGDPAAMAAVADQIRKTGGTVLDHMLTGVSPEHMKALMGEQPVGVVIPEGGTLANPRTGAEMAKGAPKEKSLDMQLANLPPGSPEAKRLLQIMRSEAEAKQVEAAPILTKQGMDMAALRYKTDGTLPQGMGRRSAAVQQDIMNRAATLTPEDEARIRSGGLDIAGNKASYIADTGALKQLQKQTDAVSAFESTATKNAKLLDDVLAKLPDSGTSILNRPLRAAEGALGSENMATFNTLRQSVQNEYARIISNPTLSGTMSDSARKEAEVLLSPSATVGQIRAALKALASEAANRHSSYQGQLNEIKGRIGGGGTMTGGSTTAQTGPAIGTKGTTKDGRAVTWDGKGWAYD